MKNTLLTAGIFVGAVAAALVAWAVIGGSGGSRKAALEEPTQEGSVGQLTIQGVAGADQLPVRSFSWHAGAPTDPATGYRSSTVQYGALEVLRSGDEVSPYIYRFGGANGAATAILDLTLPESRAYLEYGLTNAQLSEFRGGKNEKVALRYQSVAVTRSGGPSAEPNREDLVGSVTWLGRGADPIVGFDQRVVAPGTGRMTLNNAFITIPLSPLAETLKNDLVNNTNIGTVSVDLQAPGEPEPHVTYVFTNAHVQGLTDSGAAGIQPTEEVELTFSSMQVSRGSASYCYMHSGPCE